MTQSSLLSSPPPLSSNARGSRLWTPSSKSKGKRIQHPVDDIDKLPDEILEKILSTLPFKSAVKTSVLSKRWVHLWKRTLHLCVDMGFIVATTPTRYVEEVSRCLAKSMTKTINNHCGPLESCTIRHFLFQCEDGTLERWIRTVTRMKHTKELTLENYIVCVGPLGEYNSLQLATSAFSHHNLTSLSLTRYTLTETKAFKSCCNLKTLKLHDIIANVGVLNRVFRACSSLEVLLLRITSLRRRRGVLRIKNEKLEVLQVVCPSLIKNMEVNATRLEILDIGYIYCDRDNFILNAPKIRFNRNYWVSREKSHISYNISSLSEEKKRIWHELLVSPFSDLRRAGSLSVSIDAKNPKELEVLKEVLLLWGEEMIELEIIFKNKNAPGEDGESSTNGGPYKKWWDGAKPFPNAFFRVNTIWIYNFSGSNEEEFALVSCFVTQGTILDKLMIETSAYPPMKKLMTEAKVAKLIEVAEVKDDITIECF